MGRYLETARAAADGTAIAAREGDRSAQGERRESNKEAVNFMIQRACEGLSITDEQLHAELEAGGDLPDIQSGALTPKALRLTAETLSLLRYSTLSADKRHDLCEVA
jgi:hypothetical protein